MSIRLFAEPWERGAGEFKQAVLIAVIQQLSRADIFYPCLGISFGIELYYLNTVIRNGGDEGNVVRARHVVVDRDKILVLDYAALDFMFTVGRFCFKRREGYPAAAHHRVACRADHIAADGADIDAAFQHVRGAVFVRDIVAGHKLYDRNAERGGKRLDKRYVGIALAGFT